MRIPVHLVRTRVVGGLALCALALGTLHVLAGVLWLRLDRVYVPAGRTLVRLFRMDRESNLPTLFSTLLLAACGLLSALAARAAGREQRTRFGWWVCAVTFGYLAIDESAVLHEAMTAPMRRSFQLGGPLFFSWVVPAAFGVLAFVALQARFLLRLEPRTRRGLLLAGALYVSGALGMEMVGGWYIGAHTTRSLPYVLMVLVEEGLELAGLIVLCATLLGHLAAKNVTLRVRFLEGAASRGQLAPTSDRQAARRGGSSRAAVASRPR